MLAKWYILLAKRKPFWPTDTLPRGQTRCAAGQLLHAGWTEAIQLERKTKNLTAFRCCDCYTFLWPNAILPTGQTHPNLLGFIFVLGLVCTPQKFLFWPVYFLGSIFV